MKRISFGPVPSRRLGRSLGINNVSPKKCTYSCVYCQLGRTIDIISQRRPFYEPKTLVDDVLQRVNEAENSGQKVDYLTFVPDGEPTLDSNLGTEIGMLSESGLKVAVITNSSLIWREDVRNDLMEADWISMKVDSVRETIWRQINRPYSAFDLDLILNGISLFRNQFRGTFTTETMLISDLNDSNHEIERNARYLKKVEPDIAYISIPMRPPAEKWVKVPSQDVLDNAGAIFGRYLDRVEFLNQFEGTEFFVAEDPVEDILTISGVHPLREDTIEEMLKRSGMDWNIIDILVKNGDLEEVEYQGYRYYIRKFR